MASPEALQIGRIVWAEVADQNGIRKQRPAIIVSSMSDADASGTLKIVAITSRVPTTLPEDHVLLPWHPQGHPRTGLNRRSTAVCSWLSKITPSDILDVSGIVPGPELLAILSKIDTNQKS